MQYIYRLHGTFSIQVYNHVQYLSLLEAKNVLPKIKKDLVMPVTFRIIQPLDKAKKQGECH